MSFEAFVLIYKNGEPACVSRRQVYEAFGSFIKEGGAFDWHLYYGEADNCDVMLKSHDGDKSLLRGFTVLRPCGDLRFWDSMAAILKMGNIVLFFPASCRPLVAHAGVAQHLPADMVETLGEPKLVANGKQILDALHVA
jgi:hypothetical protein